MEKRIVIKEYSGNSVTALNELLIDAHMFDQVRHINSPDSFIQGTWIDDYHSHTVTPMYYPTGKLYVAMVTRMLSFEPLKNESDGTV